jgi:hypothetical protein
VTADLLAQVIIGSVLENLDVEYLINKIRSVVAERILGNNENVDDIARELHDKLFSQDTNTKDVVESIYKDSPEARHNVSVFLAAPSLAQARPQLKKASHWQFGAFVMFLNHTSRSPAGVSLQNGAPRMFRVAQFVIPCSAIIKISCRIER